jgi:hypothetical protein
MRDRLWTRAVLLLKCGAPLPLDLIVYLTSIGVDVPALEARYGA